MGSSGNRRRDGGQGLSIRTAQEMRQTEKAVDEDPTPPPSMQVFAPRPDSKDRYQVLVYSREHGGYIHRCYVETHDAARRVMDSERAHGHRVKCRELPQFDLGGTRDSNAKPEPKDPRVQALQSQLKAVWEAQGQVGIAMPSSIEKLESMLREIVLLDQRVRR